MKYNSSRSTFHLLLFTKILKKNRSSETRSNTNANTPTPTSASHTRLFPRFRQKHQKNKRTKHKVIKITQSKNPSNLPPSPLSPLISSFVRISMRLEGNRNYAWRLFIKLIAPSSLILPSSPSPLALQRSRFPFPTERNVITVVRRKIGRSPSRPAAPRWRAARTSVRNCASLCASDLMSRMQAAFLRDTR